MVIQRIFKYKNTTYTEFTISTIESENYADGRVIFNVQIGILKPLNYHYCQCDFLPIFDTDKSILSDVAFLSKYGNIIIDGLDELNATKVLNKKMLELKSNAEKVLSLLVFKYPSQTQLSFSEKSQESQNWQALSLTQKNAQINNKRKFGLLLEEATSNTVEAMDTLSENILIKSEVFKTYSGAVSKIFSTKEDGLKAIFDSNLSTQEKCNQLESFDVGVSL